VQDLVVGSEEPRRLVLGLHGDLDGPADRLLLRRGGDAAHRILAVGQAGDKSEKEENAASVIREKDRFSNELTVVFCTGEIAILK
jgi:hypothetical protein